MVRFVTGMLIALFALSLFSGAAAAGDVQWKITEKGGNVRIASPMTAVHDAVVGEVLPPGSTIATGAGGHAVLSDGKTVITANANSRLTTPADAGDAMTRFIQDVGSVLFHVEKLPTQHFEVQAPLIAAVVKGTTFTVNASATENSVAVTEGLVQVTAAQGGAQDFVPAGKTARVKAASAKELKLSASGGASNGRVVKVAIGADELNYAELTGGLVQTASVAVPETTKSVTTTSPVRVAVANTDTAVAVDTSTRTDGAVAATVDVDVAGGATTVGATADVSVGGGSGVTVDAGVDVGVGNGVGANVDVAVGAGTQTAASVGANVGVGGGSGVTVDAGVSAGVGSGVGANVGVVVGAGNETAASVGANVGGTNGVGVAVTLGGNSGLSLSLGLGGGLKLGLGRH